MELPDVCKAANFGTIDHRSGGTICASPPKFQKIPKTKVLRAQKIKIGFRPLE
jgi:hypothetical protein